MGASGVRRRAGAPWLLLAAILLALVVGWSPVR
jgi:hypothetical protein